MNHTFSLVGQSDCDEILKLATEIWNECYPGLITQDQIDYMLGRMYSSEQIKSELRRGVVWEFLAADHVRAGFMAYVIDEDAVVLNKIYIRAESRGGGLFGNALRQVVAYAQTVEAKKIRLNVNKHNLRAIKAYEKNGFKIVSDVVVDIGQGYVMDDFIMVRSVEGRN